jgi:hypothetical protein
MTVTTATAGPRFTIIIPTRERAATLEYALRTVTDQDFASLEIIVSDNASTDNTRAVVEANGDPRIRYINTGKRLSMSHNYEFALGHARGEWIGYLGDDDGLFPDTIARVDKIIQTHNVDLIRSRQAHYLWPSLVGSVGGHLSIPLGGTSEVRNCEKVLRSALAGDISYLELPMIYGGGFASREAIDRARSPDGRFFLSRIPDVYSGVILSVSCESYYWSAEPLFLNGASIASTGTSQFTRSNDPERQKAERQFALEDNIPLHDSLPFNPDGSVPRSLQALIFESYQQARTFHPMLGPLDPAQQMNAIARTAGEHREEVMAWIADFGILHGVKQIPNPMLSQQLHNFKAFIRTAWMNRLIFTPDRDPPITNIVHAAQIGGQALSMSPNPVMTALANIARKISRVF